MLAEREARRPSQKGRSNRAIFFAMQAEVKAALDEGWTVVQIYRVLQAEGRIKFSYQSFRLYVDRLILNPGHTRKTSKGDKPATPQAKKPEPAATQAADKAKGFVWKQNHSKEDLI
ncbi:hypothetical protein [Methylomonas fluvii]|nr:hypothetical protein [Methylomonas fluvii]